MSDDYRVTVAGIPIEDAPGKCIVGCRHAAHEGEPGGKCPECECVTTRGVVL